MDAQKSFAEALAFHQSGNLENAQALYENILKTHPQHLDSLHLIGVAAFQMGEFDRAKAFIEHAISLNSQVAVFHLNLGNVYYASRNFTEAKECFEKTVAIDPRSLFGWINLGNTLQELRSFKEAIVAYEKASAIQENAVEVLVGLSSAYEELADFKKAEDLCARALKLAPENPQIHSNLGLIYQKQKRFLEANLCFQKAIEKNPQLYQVHLLLAETSFLQNQWKLGFQQYDERLKDPRVPLHDYPLEALRGPLEGKHLLIYGEQGLGDSIQFVRFVKAMALKGPRQIDLLLQDELRQLCRHSLTEFSNIHLLTTSPQIENYDLTVPLMSLARLLDLDEKGFSTQSAYLKVSEAAKQKAAEFLKASSRGLKIGIKWQGDKNFKSDRFRSVPLKTFEPLFELQANSHCQFVSLQKHFGEEQLASLPPALSDSILKYECSPDSALAFEETAAIMSELDLVITTDSSIAHLSGALGKETWLLLAPVPGWRWGVEGDRTPWYPSLKLYRTSRWGEWQETILQLKEDLKSKISGR